MCATPPSSLDLPTEIQLAMLIPFGLFAACPFPALNIFPPCCSFSFQLAEGEQQKKTWFKTGITENHINEIFQHPLKWERETKKNEPNPTTNGISTWFSNFHLIIICAFGCFCDCSARRFGAEWKKFHSLAHFSFFALENNNLLKIHFFVHCVDSKFIFYNLQLIFCPIRSGKLSKWGI